MYNWIACTITKCLIEMNIIEENKYEIYAYGFEVLISYCAYILVSVIIALLTKTVLVSAFFFAGFCLLRNYGGGVHASTYKLCHLLTSLNHLIFVLFIKCFSFRYMNIFVWSTVGLMLVAIFLIAPVEHENRPFSISEHTFFKHVSRIYAVAVTIVSVALMTNDRFKFILVSYLFGTLSAILSMIIAWILKKYKKSMLHSSF